MNDDDFILHRLAEQVNANEHLVWRGRHLDTTLLLEVGDTAYLIEIRQGRIGRVQRGPFVMPGWQFALRAQADTWAQFWSATPPPGFHDLMALVKFRRLQVQGDLHPLMSNLLYFKDVLACPRAQGVSA